MKPLKFVCAAAAAAALCGCQKVEGNLSIVPNPVSIEYAGRGISLNGEGEVREKDEALAGVAALFAEVTADDAFAGMPDVDLKIDEELAAEEYVLDSRRGSVKICGGSADGVWWGLQTLRQIIKQSGDRIPGLVIKDKPAFAYRGAHLDCCRHFFSVEEVKEFIDIANLHKLNIFHWHLTEDQGWRIEIKKYPKLTEIGSVRKETLVGHYGSNKYDGTPYGGYYTQDQMREIVAYAAARRMTVVPEVEMPGHAVAALASYPELGCKGKGYEVYTTWGISDDVFCIGKEEVFEFLEGVLDEVCEIFPSEYIHIGGDEAPRVRWQNCPACQKRMKEEGLENEAQLQSYLVNRIEKYLNEKGRKIIGWDEILEGGVSTTATVMSWRGATGGIAAAKLGNDVIMTPNSHFYLDYYQTGDPQGNGEPLAIGGHLNLRKCYSFEPFEGLNEDEKSHIKGIQANMWTEYVATFEHIQQMVLPRFAALSEVSWSNGRKRDYEQFVECVRTALLPIYEADGYRYSDYAFRETPVE